MFSVGDVFVWHDFPMHNDPDSHDKDRWFLYLGSAGRYDIPLYVYLCTSTTQLHHYDPSGSRAGHETIRIEAGQFGFDEDCLLDFGVQIYDNMTMESLIAASSEITVKDRADEAFLRKVYASVLKSRFISRIVKLNIHESMNLAGITGLSKP